MKAKSKPQEYAAFDASSRFGEGLSFFEETHLQTLHEFKQKQKNKPSIQVTTPAIDGPTAETPSTSGASAAATLVPSPRADLKNAGKKEPASPGIVEDFLTASTRSSSTSSCSPASKGGKSETPSGRKGRGGGRGRKKVDYRDSVNDDDDDFVEKKSKKKSKDVSKKNNSSQGENFRHDLNVLASHQYAK